MIFHFSMASSEAITYPTLNPANPYALEKVRNKRHCQNPPVILAYLENHQQ